MLEPGNAQDPESVGEAGEIVPDIAPEPPARPACSSPLVNGAIIVHDQAELDALQGCATVHGDLTILPFESADLRPLADLTTVEGTFTLGDLYAELPSPGFPFLEGLEGLRRVTSLSLRGVSAPSLESLQGLSELTDGPDPSALSHFVAIDHCSQLVDLHGLENMAGLGGFVAKGNPRLVSVQGIQVPSVLTQFEIWDSPVRDLTPLAALTTVGYTLWFTNTALTNAAGLERVSEVDQLQFWRNGALVELNALSSLVAVHYLNIIENPSLTSLPTFGRLVETESFSADTNARLRTGPSFPELREVKSVGFSHNPLLPSILGLSNLEYAEEIYVDDNASLVALDLANLGYVRDRMQVTHNPLLDGTRLPRPPDGAIIIGANLGETTGLAPCPWSHNNHCEGPPFDNLCAPGTDTDCPDLP